MPSLLTWYRTLRHLKPRQCWYLAWRPVAMASATRRSVGEEQIKSALRQGRVALLPFPVDGCYQPESRSFCFLNITQHFPEKIDWDCREHGLLWAYHLNYFEWLCDESLSPECRLATMQEFAEAPITRTARDAYPGSLRIMAWIRFLLRFDVKDELLLSRLYSDADWLCRFPEFQLDGNHLFENALALVSAGAFFRDVRLYRKGSCLLHECIREQILQDGAHVEGSPMYHSLLLWRSLQCVELLRALPFQEDGLMELLAQTASKMLGWMQAISFSDGSWPMFHDAAEGMAPGTGELSAYAAALGVPPASVRPGESGYRMLRAGDFEVAVNAASVQPAFQPGHAHADIGTFCLHFRGRPMIVDTGISSYETGARRSFERSTQAHNTVAVGGKNSSEMWRSFRVGGRARSLSLREEGQALEIVYAPFFFPRCRHRRRFILTGRGLRIEDELEGDYPPQSQAFLHFHPGIVPRAGKGSLLAEGLEIRGSEAMHTQDCSIAKGFNRLEPALRASILFTSRLVIEIEATRC